MSTYNSLERPSDSSTALTIFAIVVVALIAIGMFMWQPWNEPVKDADNRIEITATESGASTPVSAVKPEERR